MPPPRTRSTRFALCCLAALAACERANQATEPASAPAPSRDAPAQAAGEAAGAHDAALERTVDSEMLPYAEVAESLAYGYFAFPTDMVEPLPAIVLVHDWWGLNDDVRAAARRLAAAGYIVLAVDLYSGTTAANAVDARQQVAKVVENSADVEENVRQALEFVEVAGAPSIGIAGWGYGGGWALNSALAFPERIGAVSLFYGQVATDAEKLRELKSPVLGLFGGSDRIIKAETVEAFAEATRLAGNPAEIEVYPGAGHGFADPARSAYDAAVAEDAWRRMLEFFARSLPVDADS